MDRPANMNNASIPTPTATWNHEFIPDANSTWICPQHAERSCERCVCKRLSLWKGRVQNVLRRDLWIWTVNVGHELHRQDHKTWVFYPLLDPVYGTTVVHLPSSFIIIFLILRTLLTCAANGLIVGRTCRMFSSFLSVLFSWKRDFTDCWLNYWVVTVSFTASACRSMGVCTASDANSAPIGWWCLKRTTHAVWNSLLIPLRLQL